MGNPAIEPVKLRSTCDRCAALKVRCDKGKPRCERCQASGSECKYRPYRWKTKVSSNPLSQGHLCRPAVRTPPGHMLGIPDPQQSAIRASGVNITSDDHTTAFLGLSSACAPTSTSSDFGHNSYKPSSLPDFSHFDFSAAFPEDVPNELSEPSSIVSSLFAGSNHEMFDMTTPETEEDFLTPGAAANSCSCADMALSIAEELYRGALCGPTGNVLSSPPSDLILKVSRAVVRKLDQLLVQGPCACSHDPSLLFMLASIISKTLDWYRVVFNGISQATNPDAAPETVPTAPIQFGDFKLNSEEQRRMEAQFLLCELQSLRRVLGILAKSAADRFHGGLREIGPLADLLHEFLSSALEKLMANVNSFCVFRLSTRGPS
ncbi:hypothetical protein BJX76DRAFT_19160 [Aspergillus varians]